MTYTTRNILMAVAACSLIVAGAAEAQAAKPMKEDKPGQLAQAKITPAAARATALGRVKGAVIQEEGIEHEDGRLVYSFDMKVAGESGIEEVLVDAMTGAVVSVEHETPADEKAEAAKDAKDAKAAKSTGAKKPIKKPTSSH